VVINFMGSLTETIDRSFRVSDLILI